jgi:hypothetical protein
MLASLRAHPTVLVFARMSGAFFPAGSTRLSTYIEYRFQYGLITTRTPGPKCAARQTNIRAVQIQPNALSERLHPVFCQACIGTRSTGLGTVIAGVDTIDERRIHVSTHIGMRTDHRLGMHDITPGGLLKREVAPQVLDQIATTATFRRRPIASAMSRSGTPSSAGPP